MPSRAWRTKPRAPEPEAGLHCRAGGPGEPYRGDGGHPDRQPEPPRAGAFPLFHAHPTHFRSLLSRPLQRRSAPTTIDPVRCRRVGARCLPTAAALKPEWRAAASKARGAFILGSRPSGRLGMTKISSGRWPYRYSAGASAMLSSTWLADRTGGHRQPHSNPIRDCHSISHFTGCPPSSRQYLRSLSRSRDRMRRRNGPIASILVDSAVSAVGLCSTTIGERGAGTASGARAAAFLAGIFNTFRIARPTPRAAPRMPGEGAIPATGFAVWRMKVGWRASEWRSPSGASGATARAMQPIHSCQGALSC